MITVVIKDAGEPNVVELTYLNLWKELKDIPEASLLIHKNWLDTLTEINTKYVCFVEPDCLVSSGYFESLLGLFAKNNYYAKLAMLTSATAVLNWANRFYGYSLSEMVKGLTPNKNSRSNNVYPVQIGYVPGAIIRTSMLKKLIEDNELPENVEDDLILFSSELSLGFWRQGTGKGKTAGSIGNRTHINPDSAYCTTESYVNDLAIFDPGADDLVEMFKRELI